MGEVVERSEDGEGIQGCKALSVTCGDSSPRGRAKGLYLHVGTKMERICIDTLHSLFYDRPSNVGAALFACKKKNMVEKFLVAVDKK